MKKYASNLLAMAVVTMTAFQAAARQPSAFDIALNNGDTTGAIKEIEKISEQNPTKEVLDSYYGRIFAAASQGQIAEPYLIRAIANAQSRSDKDKLSFELARVHELDGSVIEAEADYRRLTAASTDPAVRQKATLSLARLRLGAAPGDAITLLMPLIDDSGPGSARWEAHLLLSRAYAIQGRATDSHAALAAAWQEAPSAPAPADAIAETAMDMALDRAAANDRRGEIELISMGGTTLPFAGTAQIPLCGGSLQPEDTVTVAIEVDAKQRRIYSAVRASRPGIAQLFTIPLAVTRQHIDGPAMYVTLRCRNALDVNVRFAGGAIRNLVSWLAEKGYHPPLRQIDPDDGDPLTQLKTQLQGLEAKVGTQSPVLTPTLLHMATLQAAPSRLGNAGNLAEAKATAERALRILTAANAPAEVLEQTRMQTTFMLAQNHNIPDVAGPATLEVMEAMAARADTTPAQAFAAFNSLRGWQLRPAQQLTLADRLLRFLDARKVSAHDPIRQAVELRRASILRDIGTVAGIGTRLSASGIASNLCSAADRPPSIPPAAIPFTSDDYPRDLLRRSIMGLTAIELSIDASGKIEKERTIVSQPPGLFDDITKDKVKAVTLLPARQADRPVACQGMLQNVRWQLPTQGSFDTLAGGYSSAQE